MNHYSLLIITFNNQNSLRNIRQSGLPFLAATNNGRDDFSFSKTLPCSLEHGIKCKKIQGELQSPMLAFGSTFKNALCAQVNRCWNKILNIEQEKLIVEVNFEL